MSDLPLDADLIERAVAVARRWVDESADAGIDPAAQRLAAVLKDPNGLPFTIGFIDGVMRPESLAAAASAFHRLAPITPGVLPAPLRAAVRAGGAVAPVLPAATVPIARRALRRMVGHLVVDARPEKLGAALAQIREAGARLDLGLLREAVLSDAEARRRLDGIHGLIRRDDVDRISMPVPAIVGGAAMWAFDELVDTAVDRLLPLYLDAAEHGVFITLDMAEHRDLDVTIAVFTRLLDRPQLRDLEAGIVLQTYLPDALPALHEVTAWARDRVADGGARIKVRLVKGANLAEERRDAVMHGWPLATHATKMDADAGYLRCLDHALRAENAAAVRIGVAGHNLFHIAWAWLLAGDRGVQADVDVEMLLGVAQAQLQAVSREVGPVLRYVPVADPDEFDGAARYLVRLLEESASSENFLSAVSELADDPDLFARERDRFVSAVNRAQDPTLPAQPNRTQDRPQEAAGHGDIDSPADGRRARMMRSAAVPPDDLTRAVMGIARAAHSDTDEVVIGAAERFGGEAFVETAVFARREGGARALGAPGFAHAPDSDPTVPANREWAREILARVETSRAGDVVVDEARIGDADQLERVIRRVRAAAAEWGARPAADRAAVLVAAGGVLAQRRAQLIEVASSEIGEPFAEADTEASELIDLAHYYAATSRELDRVSGAIFVPSQLTVVAPPWNSPLAICGGGVLAALAAGSGVVCKPSRRARRCAAVIIEALWDAGVPRDLLALVDLGDRALDARLIAHPDVDRVILTGSRDTAELFGAWRPDLPLLADTGGKNAMIVTPSADLHQAASDLVHSAFGHAGQNGAAASLAILVGPVGRSRRFARQLVDATRSLRVGPPSDPRAEVGPVIEAPRGALAWALTTLDEGEQWLVQPRLLDSPPEYAGRLWSPGIRVGVRPGSRTHREEFFGPVLGVMHAPSLGHAIDLQNAVDSGLSAGLHTQSPDDLARWLDTVEAGNLYVNRRITGAIVQRQPFGGWKRSSVGPGAKTGGPNYLVGLGSWRPAGGAGASSTLHLRGLDTRITDIIEAAQPTLDYESFDWLRRAALSDAIAWDREFGQVKDVSRLHVERNLFRYRPAPVAIRATGDAQWHAVLRVVVAAVRTGSTFSLSTPVGLPAAVRHALGVLEVPVYVESDPEWLQRMTGGAAQADDVFDDAAAIRPGRVRLVGAPDAVRTLHAALTAAVGGDPGIAVYPGEVTTAGRLELLPFLREQAVSITAHRWGTPDSWSEAVI